MLRFHYSLYLALFFVNSVPIAFGADMSAALMHYDEGNFGKVLLIIEPLAEKGNPEAQSLLGWMYFKGQGVAKSNKKAIQWYVLSAEKGNSGAEFNLGFMYHQGHGVPQDYSEAVRWYIKAQAKDNVFAHYNLGLLVEEGKGIKEDPKLAFRLYLFGAKRGHRQSMGKVGHYFSQGEGVDLNYKLAYQWAFLAAKGGDRLGELVLDEVSVHLEKSTRQALQRSAESLLVEK